MTRASRKYDVELSDAAERDLREITRWTAGRFGREQARAYVAMLRQAFRELAAGPAAPGARARVDLGDQLYTLHTGRGVRRARHLIVFRITPRERGGLVEVLRILHDAMDLARHLPGEASEEEDAT